MRLLIRNMIGNGRHTTLKRKNKTNNMRRKMTFK
jgi:hypothetical protein